MNDTEYAYAVARIRAFEAKMLTSQDIEQLLAYKTQSECVRFLSDKGWDNEKNQSISQMLYSENEKTWALLKEITPDENIFDVFLFKNDYHNLKAVIKSLVTNSGKNANIYLPNGTVKIDDIKKAVMQKEFELLPKDMKECAQKAVDVLLRTGDGQLSDIIVDKGCLDAMYNASKLSKSDFIKEYSEITVAVSNIKIAIRCAKTKKSLDFIKLALAKCSTLDVELLANASLSLESLIEYLKYTPYSQGAEILEKDGSQFEKWCDNLIMSKIKMAKRSSFGENPLIGYLLGRQTEIKAVRIILTAKANDMDISFIRERLGELYV